ncbi:MAG TPA: Pycsar system effector family protein [Xanthomonadaceae bacterium]|nr:Pycsar system effector family protein [Xanthomonadaceae bacterium]
MNAATDHSGGAPERPLADVPERSSGDHLLRLAQQHQVMLSQMADTKANIIITVASIVLTLVLGRIDPAELRWSAIVLGVFTLLALLLAILAVLPKYRAIRKISGEVPPHFNLMFFGHFVALDEERWLREMAKAMQPGTAYETVLRDVYGVGSYLAHYKYPYLRTSYLFFLTGFLAACMIEAWMLLFG